MAAVASLNGKIPPLKKVDFDYDFEKIVCKKLRAFVNSFYITQQTRIKIGNAICQNVYQKSLDIKPGEKVTKEEMDKKQQKLLNILKQDYKTVMDGIVGERVMISQVRNKIAKCDLQILSDAAEFLLIDQWMQLDKIEDKSGRNLDTAIQNVMMWEHYFKHISAIGSKLAGVMLSYLDIEKGHYPSSFHRYVGLIPGCDGLGISRKKQHMVEKPYTDKAGNEQTNMRADYNVWVRSKLVFSMIDSLRKQEGKNKNMKNNVYMPLLRAYKQRLATDPFRQAIVMIKNKKPILIWPESCDWVFHLGFEKGTERIHLEGGKIYSPKELNIAIPDQVMAKLKNAKPETETPLYAPGRIDAMARRKTCQFILTDLHVNWRRNLGLQHIEPYHSGKLGFRQHYHIMVDEQLTPLMSYDYDHIADPFRPMVGGYEI